ncbi:transcription factor bHLH30-like [Typha angustifolia]|uniref:transcription factor bHLH30-like n=1 Tax=Typha angustifolia TaxID=59011 RepID=UPI003C2C0BE9
MAGEGSHGKDFPPLLLPRPSNSAPPFLGKRPLNASWSEEERAAMALRIHSQAEKKRRERINAHLSTLRRMIPNSNKMDKASLLARVIEHLKELKSKTFDINQLSMIPKESNEVIVECDDHRIEHAPSTSDDKFYIKASVCCDDREDLFADFVEGFHLLSLRTVRADITSIGGRILSVFVLCSSNRDERMSMSSVKDNIAEMLGRVASSNLPASSCFIGKRQRPLGSQYFSRSV